MKFKTHFLFQFITVGLRGAGQVLFQENAMTGLLFIIGILWGSYSANAIHIGLGAILGLFVSSAMALFLRADDTKFKKGLYGYNGILVGIALPTFLTASPLMWLALLFGSMASTTLMIEMDRRLHRWNLSPLTFPFVLITWIILYVVGPAARVNFSASEIPFQSFAFYCEGTLKGLSQIFLFENNVTGIIFLLALMIGSMRAAGWALIGSLFGLLIAEYLGVDRQSLSAGLYGYSAAITSIAIGSVFFKPSVHVFFYTFLGIVVTTLIQIILNRIFVGLNLPSLTAAFVFATWILLVPKFRGYISNN